MKCKTSSHSTMSALSEPSRLRTHALPAEMAPQSHAGLDTQPSRKHALPPGSASQPHVEQSGCSAAAQIAEVAVCARPFFMTEVLLSQLSLSVSFNGGLSLCACV